MMRKTCRTPSAPRSAGDPSGAAVRANGLLATAAVRVEIRSGRPPGKISTVPRNCCTAKRRLPLRDPTPLPFATYMVAAPRAAGDTATAIGYQSDGRTPDGTYPESVRLSTCKALFPPQVTYR